MRTTLWMRETKLFVSFDERGWEKTLKARRRREDDIRNAGGQQKASAAPHRKLE